ncbi:hypothetical protein SLNWT_6740 [Streptomyces albus]|uniref:Uncharacterized protein n=1 Tax=Streptomyces albus (strain ATCC 21838 / DSM 41398 / FERM P-419 / JCM 4703 / NBRC 107858) TaxID=1081613 RepID=A0A0B5F8D1_STRA4|nr:hypothetical protein SLNWT_6740 [Streptomyces albus]AYN37115.1 hypothetical protein DUI70_6621 [Streptomyces albus]
MRAGKAKGRAGEGSWVPPVGGPGHGPPTARAGGAGAGAGAGVGAAGPVSAVAVP